MSTPGNTSGPPDPSDGTLVAPTGSPNVGSGTDPATWTDAGSRDHPADAPQVPGYEILGDLGRGGMGVVYKARQRFLNRIVALKMISDRSDPLARVRFLAEAEAIAALRHPNIVEVFEFGESGGRPYFALEYVPGGSLEKRLVRSPLPPAEAAALIESLARATHVAHQAGIVHRDIKPANILIGSDGSPKVADFGLVKRVEGASGLTVTGAVMGTPSYMAPEQANDSTQVGPPADVYGLGATLYHLLTGRPPFRAATPIDTLRLLLTDDPVPPRKLQPGLARDLDTICLKCLEKNPARRYASAAALADDLARFRAGEPITARRPTLLERARRQVRRHPRTAAVIATAVVVAVAVGGGLVAWSAHTRQQEMNRLLAAGESALEAAREARSEADADRRFDEAMQAFAAARATDGHSPAALRGLRDVYEARGRAYLDRGRVDAARGLLLPLAELARATGDGDRLRDYARAVEGTARWEAVTTPPGAAVTLTPLDEHLLPLAGAVAGTTPLASRDVTPGDYLVEFTLPDRPTVRYSLHIPRGAEVRIDVPLPASADYPPGMVFVPPGEFRFGDPDRGTARTVRLPGYFIDRTEVTGAQYEAFLLKTDWPPPDDWGDSRTCPPGRRNWPVTGVTWYDAAAYAAWAGKRLPTEEEWEKAARGADARPYPWGRRFEPRRAFCRDSTEGFRAGGRPAGASPYGALDLAGSAWEWTRGRLVPGEAARVVRGGCTADDRDHLLAFRRQGAPPGGVRFGALAHIGFRCVKPFGPDPSPVGPPGDLVGAADHDAAIAAAVRDRQPARAHALAEELLRRNPRSAAGNAWRGFLLVEDRKPAEAWPHLTRAFVADPYFRYQGQSEGNQPLHVLSVVKATAAALTAAGKAPDAAALDIPTLRTEAKAALDADRAADAEKLLRRALAIDADDPEANEWLAQAVDRLGKPGAADARRKRIDGYRAAVREDPENPKLLDEFADFLSADLAAVAEAVPLADAAAALDPGKAAYHHTRARLLLAAGRRADAAAAAARAVELDPDEPKYRDLRDRCQGYGTGPK